MMVSGADGTHAEHAAPGVALRAARTAQNLSVGEVARQLRLSVAQIEALEASAFERLPGPVFVRGFIRNYARLLHLDPDVLLRSVAPVLPADEERVPAISRGEPMPAARTPRWPRYAALLVLLLVALAAYELYLAGAPEPGEAPKPAVSVPAPAAPSSSAAAPAAPPEPGAVRDESATASGVRSDALTPEDAAGAAPPAAVADERTAQPSSSGEGELQLAFEADSWVEVRDRNGKTLFSRLNPKGTEQRVTGMRPLVVVIGNPRGVRLTYNDRLVDLDPHTKRDVARLTLE
jgi:cytoskeleton protein RodZ